MSGPLKGVRVLDLSLLLPGPFCTLLLARLGAEVIKIETPLAGDYLRMAPAELGFGEMFEALNAGKQSVAVNYRNPLGRDVFLRLASRADVIVESFRPGVVDKWGIGYAAVRGINPRVVYCSLSGYGQAGPYRDRAGHDLNYVAVAGLLALQLAGDSPPQVPNVPIADLAGGMLAALAITAALAGRAQTDAGAYLDVGLMDAPLLWAAPLAASRQGRAASTGLGPLAGGLACYNLYAAADGRSLTLAALEPNFWAAFCTRVERPDWIARHLDPALIPEVRGLFRSRSSQAWLSLFQDSDFCFEAVPTSEEAAAHPQVRARLDHWGAGVAAPAPALGAHTRTALREAGVPEDEIDSLAARGLIRIAEAGG